MDWGAVDARDVVQALAARFGFDFAVAVDFLLARQLQQEEHGGGEQQQQQQQQHEDGEEVYSRNLLTYSGPSGVEVRLFQMSQKV